MKLLDGIATLMGGEKKKTDTVIKRETIPSGRGGEETSRARGRTRRQNVTPANRPFGEGEGVSRQGGKFGRVERKTAKCPSR